MDYPRFNFGLAIMQSRGKIAHMQNIDIKKFVSAVDNGENSEATKEDIWRRRHLRRGFGPTRKATKESVAQCETNVTSATYINIVFAGIRFGAFKKVRAIESLLPSHV